MGRSTHVDLAAPRRLLFVQGGGKGAHAFDEPLVANLRAALGAGWTVDYPRLRNEGDPSVASWGPQLDRLMARLDPRSIIVAHSIGATILVNELVPRRTEPGFAGLFLISAPFVGEGGWPSGEIAPMSDIGSRLPRGMPVFIYQGTVDDTVPVAHADLYARAIPSAVVRRIEGADHQLHGDLSIVATDILAIAKGR